MFTRLFRLMQLRRSTAFLLSRADEHLLQDIGLTRADLEAMNLGLIAPYAPCGPFWQGIDSTTTECRDRALPVAG